MEKSIQPVPLDSVVINKIFDNIKVSIMAPFDEMDDELFTFAMKDAGGPDSFMKDYPFYIPELDSAPEKQQEYLCSCLRRHVSIQLKMRLDKLKTVKKPAGVSNLKSGWATPASQPGSLNNSSSSISSQSSQMSASNRTSIRNYALNKDIPPYGIDGVYLSENYDGQRHYDVYISLIEGCISGCSNTSATAVAMCMLAFTPMIDHVRVFKVLGSRSSVIYWYDYDEREWIVRDDCEIQRYAYKMYEATIIKIRNDNAQRILTSDDEAERNHCEVFDDKLRRHLNDLGREDFLGKVWKAIVRDIRKRPTPKLRLRHLKTNTAEEISEYNIAPMHKARLTDYTDGKGGLHPDVILFKYHLEEILCNNEEVAFRASKKVLRIMVYDMKKSEKIMTFGSGDDIEGAGGAGKSKFFQFLGSKILGYDLYHPVETITALLKDNNIFLEHKLLVVVDDMENIKEAKRKGADLSKLKSMVTSNRMTVKKLFEDTRAAKNFATYVCLANYAVMFPSDGENTLRRFLAMQVSPKRVGDRVYFEMLIEMFKSQDAANRIFSWICSDEFLAECADDISNVMTIAKAEQREDSTSIIVQFYNDIFTSGTWGLRADRDIVLDRSVRPPIPYTCSVSLSQQFRWWQERIHLCTKGDYKDNASGPQFSRKLNRVDKGKFLLSVGEKRINGDKKSRYQIISGFDTISVKTYAGENQYTTQTLAEYIASASGPVRSINEAAPPITIADMIASSSQSFGRRTIQNQH